MNRYFGLAATLFAPPITLSLVQPYAVAQSFQQVEAIARGVTVQIDGQAPGSGVIVAKQRQTYFVLTAAHVVASADEYEVVTPDGKKYPIDYKQVRKIEGVDLALVPFTSPQNYQVVSMGRSSQVKEDTPIYIAGFPLKGVNSTQTIYQFSAGAVLAQASRPLSNGYALAYLNSTFAGMSGGPILNQQGQLIGIHGASKTQFTENQGINPQTGVKVGLNLGIPIDTFLRSAAQVMPTMKFPIAPPPSPITEATAANMLIQAADQVITGKIKEAMETLEQAIRLQPNYAAAYYARAGLGNRQEAVADYDQAIRINPNFSAAYLERGILRAELRDLQGAIADFDQAIRINPNYALAYYNRGTLRSALGNRQGAIADFDQAIRINPNYALAYNNRGNARNTLGDRRGAIVDFDQAIRINPDYALTYFNRGNVRDALGDRQGAITDYNQAIRLNPNYALAYNNRGATRNELGDRQGAIADFQKTAALARAQGNTNLYEMAVNNLKILQQ